MKIARIEALRLHWDPKDPPTASSAFACEPTTGSAGWARHPPRRAASPR